MNGSLNEAEAGAGRLWVENLFDQTEAGSGRLWVCLFPLSHGAEEVRLNAVTIMCEILASAAKERGFEPPQEHLFVAQFGTEHLAVFGTALAPFSVFGHKLGDWVLPNETRARKDGLGSASVFSGPSGLFGLNQAAEVG